MESDEDSDSDSDSDDEDAGRRQPGSSQEAVAVAPRGKKRPALSAEELALGEKMIYSKKSKRDLMDAGWNR